jgi:arylsulfatase A
MQETPPRCRFAKMATGLLFAFVAWFNPRLPAAVEKPTPTAPNVIIIFVDDLGYGDLGCYGSLKHRTPHIDHMAREGMRFTSFYMAAPVCTPSRAALLTGCYPRRVSMHLDPTSGHVAWFPISSGGLAPSETTIAEILKERGYATMCVGKWHLGDQSEFLPTRQGFDGWFGIPYSNDGGFRKGTDWPPLPLMRNETVIEAPAVQETLTERYTREAEKFIETNRERPFFLYLPHTFVHDPLHAGDAFRGKSANGIFGDAVEEIDWSTGEILETLKRLGLDARTLVVLTSDNGAAYNYGGSNLPLRGFKGQTTEGGMRVPCIMRWPGQIPAGRVCSELATAMDLMPTIARLTGAAMPSQRIIDGKDIWSLLHGEPGAKSPHEVFYYYFGADLRSVRAGRWKLWLPGPRRILGTRYVDPCAEHRLYDLDRDPGEQLNLLEPDLARALEVRDTEAIVSRLLEYAEKARKDLGDGEKNGVNQRPCGSVDKPTARVLAEAR